MTRVVKSKNLLGLVVLVVMVEFAAPVAAEPVKIEAVLSPKEQLRLDFADGSKRYLAMVRREGKATGQGVLSGGTATEWGMHDVTPGVGANSQGYLVFTMPDGDIVYIKSHFRAVFVTGPDKKPVDLLNGSWEVVGGTGKLKAVKGAGTLRIERVSPTDRKWILEGDLVQAAQ